MGWGVVRPGFGYSWCFLGGVLGCTLRDPRPANAVSAPFPVSRARCFAGSPRLSHDVTSPEGRQYGVGATIRGDEHGDSRCRKPA